MEIPRSEYPLSKCPLCSKPFYWGVSPFKLLIIQKGRSLIVGGFVSIGVGLVTLGMIFHTFGHGIMDILHKM